MRPLSRPLSFRSAVSRSILACVFLAAGMATAAPPPGLAGSGVATVPADAAFFSSTLRVKEQIDRFKASNAYAKLRSLPAISRAMDSWEEQRDAPGSPVSMFLTFLELPENEQAVDLLADMVATDTFVYGDPSCIKLLKLGRILSAAQQRAAFNADLDDDEEMEEEAIETEEEVSVLGRLRVIPVAQPVAIEEAIDVEITPFGSNADQAAAVLEALAANLDLLEVPDIVWGFKTGKKEAAAFQLKRIEVLAKLLAELSPEAAGAMARKKVAGGEVLTFTLSGKLVPWDDVVEQIEAEIGASEELDAVIAKARKTDIVVAIGIVGDWVILSFGDSIDHLDKLVLPGGKGQALIDTPQFAKLVPHGDKPLTGISYLSGALANVMVSTTDDLEPLIAAASMAVERSNAAEGAADAVKEWLDQANAEYVKRLPKPGPWLSFSFMTPTGYEGFAWSWFQNVPLDGSKPLSLLDHAGGDPIAAGVSRFTSDPTFFATVEKLARDASAIFSTFAVPEMSDDERERFDTFMESFVPLAEELASIFTDKFIAALADGQVGIVFDAKTTTDKLHAELPSSAEPLPVPELSIVLPLADRKLFVDGLEAFFAWGDNVLAEVRKANPDAVPEDYEIPSPDRTKVAGGTVWSFKLPGAGLDEQIKPAIGVGDKVAVFTFVPGHAGRLLRPAPLATGKGVSAFDAPLASASAMSFPGFVDAVEPWVVYFTRYGCVMASEGSVDPAGRLSADDETAEAAEALTHVRAILDVARCLKTVVSETRSEDGAFVTHWKNVIHDLPKP